MIRAVIEAMVIVSGIVDAPMVVIILVSGIVIVNAVSIMAWRVIHRLSTKSGAEPLGLRLLWRNGKQSQYRDHKKKILHRVLILN